MPKARPGGALLTGFSEDGERFVIVAPDCRTRVFDTSSGRCSINVAGGSNVGSAKSSSGELASACCWGWLEKERPGVFVGGAAGGIKALDAIDGEIKWTSEKEGRILSLCWNEGKLFSSVGPGSFIDKIQPSSGDSLGKFETGKHPAAQIRGVPGSNQLLVGSSTLALWDVDSEEVVAKYVGHATPVTAISFSPNGKFGLSTAEGERHIAVWSISNCKKKKNKAVCTLSMNAPVKHMDTQKRPGRSKTEKKDFLVVAVSMTGLVHIWNCRPKKMTKMDVALWATVGLEDKGGNRHDGIISAKLEGGAEVPTLLLARGNTAKPVFERIQLPHLEAEPAVLPLKPIQGGLLLADAAVEDNKKKKRKREVVLGPNNEGEEVLIRGMGLANASKQTVMENDGAGDRLTQKIVGERHSGEEATLGDRLMALEERMQEVEEPRTDQDVSISASSINVLVTQAVQSSDFALLAVLVSKTARSLAVKSVRDMDPSDAAALLSMLIDRFSVNSLDVEALLPWIRPVLEYHAGYLMSAPAMRQQLSSLRQTMGSRLGNFTSLLTLMGRTRLLVAQMQNRDRKKRRAATVGEGPEVVFQIGESDVGQNDEDVEEENVGLHGLQIENAGDTDDGGGSSEGE